VTVAGSHSPLTAVALIGRVARDPVLVSVTGKSVKRPPPCTVSPALALSVLRVTFVLSSVSSIGGELKRLPFQMPPPRATPVGPFATSEFSVKRTFQSTSRPSFTRLVWLW
jgi:hypothetical protein